MLQKKQGDNMKIKQIRNATVKITYAGKTFLTDPMFAPKDAYEPIPDCFTSYLRWPLCELPESTDEITKNVDAVIMTHFHIDHFDEYAANTLPKDIKIFVQDETDQTILSNYGFTNLETISYEGTRYGDITLYKTDCVHGIKEKTMPYFNALKIRHEAMGVVFKNEKEKTLYLTGDTIWCDFVKNTLEKFLPEIIIINAADAQLKTSGSIIMGKKDIAALYNAVPYAKIIASHMDTVGHATLNRKELRDFVEKNKLENTVFILDDGESTEFSFEK